MGGGATGDCSPSLLALLGSGHHSDWLLEGNKSRYMTPRVKGIPLVGVRKLLLAWITVAAEEKERS